MASWLGGEREIARAHSEYGSDIEVDVPTDFHKTFGTVVAARIDAVLLFEYPIMITSSLGRTVHRA
jgi:hypothetical protein